MPKNNKEVVTVKGGRIVRDAATGRFEEVQKTTGETTRLTVQTVRAVEAASSRRSDALRRLADR